MFEIGYQGDWRYRAADRQTKYLDLPDNEGEIGYRIGAPFWGQGLIPEATREIIRHAFVEILWCGYFDGNENSKRVQENCGFIYRRTNRDIHWKLTD